MCTQVSTGISKRYSDVVVWIRVGPDISNLVQLSKYNHMTLIVQIQAVTSVGGGMYSSPVIISYNNNINDDTSQTQNSSVIIGLSVSVAVLILLLLITGIMAVIYIM